MDIETGEHDERECMRIIGQGSEPEKLHDNFRIGQMRNSLFGHLKNIIWLTMFTGSRTEQKLWISFLLVVPTVIGSKITDPG